jgi:hypothetical protein
VTKATQRLMTIVALSALGLCFLSVAYYVSRPQLCYVDVQKKYDFISAITSPDAKVFRKPMRVYTDPKSGRPEFAEDFYRIDELRHLSADDTTWYQVRVDVPYATFKEMGLASPEDDAKHSRHVAIMYACLAGAVLCFIFIGLRIMDLGRLRAARSSHGGPA